MAGVAATLDAAEALGFPAGVRPEAVAQIEAVLNGAANDWTRELIRVWPVDTGASLRAWTVEVRGFVWLIRNPVDYVEWVHLAGTPRWDALWPQLLDLAEQLFRAALADIDAIVQSDRLARAASAFGAVLSGATLLPQQPQRARARDRSRRRRR